MHDSDPVRRLCAAVAVHRRPAASGTGPRGRPYRRMVAAIRSACAAAGLDRALLQGHSSVPDGQDTDAGAALLVMPAGMNEARVITDLVHSLDDAITEARRAGTEPLHVVIAFDQGITWLTESGFEGCVVTAVHRLCAEEATPAATPAAVRGVPEHGVRVVISAALLDDLAPPPPGGDDRAAAGFEPLSVELPGRRIAAWSYPSGRRFRFPGQN
ncbi:hypothetical protein [Actinomadura rubrisoli]|uniref:Uncharacterized protein n=1 Tax=Actinomadura rubrisoli TaxID=2530368 RepID=A0A4R5C768_9ACTN|nr:hypothetical protein [Actinomadura rubrisoli]TDD93940.1 hypothetical protein E1298_07940 [Actinomadura rubrisoli]